jgi:hypothetical protein
MKNFISTLLMTLISATAAILVIKNFSNIDIGPILAVCLSLSCAISATVAAHVIKKYLEKKSKL